MPVKNWCYGAYEPVANSDLVYQQMKLAHQYRNKLVELELERRRLVEVTLLESDPEYARLVEMTAEAERLEREAADDISRMRSKIRSRVPASQLQLDRLSNARKNLKSLRKELKAAKKAVIGRLDVQQQLAEITEFHRASLKDARKTSGLYWGNYLVVEDAAKDFGRGAPPRFKRFDGRGCVAVQIQNGLSVEDAMAGKDTKLQISEDLVRIRVGSDENKKPVWAEFPIVMHRPLPEGGQIKWAFVHRSMVGPTPEWKLRLCVEADFQPRMPIVDHGACAVHPGWRIIDGQLRVAVMAYSPNRGSGRERHESLYLSAREISWLEKASDLQSIRSKNFNEAIKDLSTWLKDRIATEDGWLVHDTKSMHTWKSEERLHRLVEKWRNNRFENDEWAFDYLEAWRKQDKHLWLWKAHGTAKQIRRRDNLYRVFAAGLAKRFSSCVIPKIDLSSLLETEQVDEEVTQVPRQRRLARLAAVGTLIRFLKEAMPGRVVEVDPEGISVDCQFCESPMEKTSALVSKCVECGKRSDQDYRAAVNQLRRRGVGETVKHPGEQTGLSKRQQQLRTGKKQKVKV